MSPLRRLAVLLLVWAGTASAGGALQPLPLLTGVGSGEPVLSTGLDGTLVLSWLEPTTAGRHALRWSRWRGEGWGAPATVFERDSLLANWADVPAVIPTRGDTLFAYALRRTASGAYDDGVEVVRSVDGGAQVSAPQSLHDGGGPGEHGFVSAVPAPLGADFVWLDGRAMAADPVNGTMMLRHAHIAPDGRPGPSHLLDARTCECCQTGLVRTRRGLVAVYRDRSEHDVRDIHVVRERDGAWSDPAPVAREGWVVEGCPVNGPAIAAAGDTLLVAWFTGLGDTMRVHAAWSFDGGDSFGPVQRLDGGDAIGRVDVAMLPDGSAAVLWIENERDAARLRVRRVPMAGAPGAPLTLSTTVTSRRAGFPRLACTGEALVFAWTEPGDASRVRSARLPLTSLPR